MPFYEYECTKCHHQMEVLQKISDPPLKKCEKCRGKVKKLISQSTFHLKGSGWYVTDYASKSGGNDVKTGSEEKSGSKTAKETKNSSSDKASKKKEKKETKTAKAKDK